MHGLSPKGEMGMKLSMDHRTDNRGFSLVELLIAIAIAGIVGASVFGFMTVGAKTFSYNSADVSIQNEQQLAFNQIQELVIDTAVGVEYYDKSTGAKVSEDSEIPVGHDKLLRLNNIDSVYEIWWSSSGEKLYYSEFAATVDSGTNEVIKGSASVSDALMSEYIKGFVVDLSRLLTNRVVRVELAYDKNGRTLTSSHNITLRNQVVSTNKIEEKLKEAISLSVNTIPNEIKGKKIIYAEPGENVDLKNVWDGVQYGYHVYDNSTPPKDITATQPLGYGFASGSTHKTTGSEPTTIGYNSGILHVSKAEETGSFTVLVYCQSDNTCKLAVEVRVVRTTGVSVNFIKGTEAVNEISNAGSGDEIYQDDLIVNETFKLEAVPSISWTESSVDPSERDANDTAKLQTIESNIRNNLTFIGMTGYDDGDGTDDLFKATGSLSVNPCEFKMSPNFTFGTGEASYYTKAISVRAYCKYSLDKFGADKHGDWNGAAYRKKADFNLKFTSDLKRGKPNHISKVTDTLTCAKGLPGDFWTHHVYLLEVSAIERDYNDIDPKTGMPSERKMSRDEYIRSFDISEGSNEGNTITWICPTDWRLDCEYEFMFTVHIAHAKNPTDATKGIYVLPYGGYTEADYEYTSNTSEPTVFSPFSVTFNPKAKYSNIVVKNPTITAKSQADPGNNVTYYARKFGEYMPRGMQQYKKAKYWSGYEWVDDPIDMSIILNDQFTWRTDVWKALIESKSTQNSSYKWKVYEPSYDTSGNATWNEYTSRNYICDYNMDQNDIKNRGLMFRYFVSQDDNGYLSMNTYKDNINRNIPSRLRICPDIYWNGEEYNTYFLDKNYVECVFWNIKVPYEGILGDLYKSTGWGNSYDTCYFPGPDEPDFPGATQSAIWYYAGYGNDSGYPTQKGNDDKRYYDLRYSLTQATNLDGSSRWTLKLRYESDSHELKDIATYTYNNTTKTWDITE